MRARGIKPGFYENEDLAECSFAARLIYPGLWMMADRAGRLEYRPKRIKARLLPYDAIEVEPLLRELESHGLILTYEANGQRLIWVPGFTKHQHPHHKEGPSKLPPHPSDTTQDQGEPETSLGQDQGEPEIELGLARLAPDSGLLIPDTQEACVRGERKTPKLDRQSKASRPDDWKGFAAIWAVYPVKQEQEAAWNEFCRLKDNGTLAPPGIIRDKVIDLKTNDSRWLRGIGIPSLAKWLAGKRWNDEPYEDNGQDAAPHIPVATGLSLEEYQRRMAGATA